MDSTSAEERFIVLPDGDEIVARCTKVCDEPTMVNRFYPHLRKLEGRELLPMGLALTFALAISDFMSEQGMPSVIEPILYRFIPLWVEELVEDEEVVAEVNKIIMETLSPPPPEEGSETVATTE